MTICGLSPLAAWARCPVAGRAAARPAHPREDAGRGDLPGREDPPFSPVHHHPGRVRHRTALGPPGASKATGPATPGGISGSSSPDPPAGHSTRVRALQPPRPLRRRRHPPSQVPRPQTFSSLAPPRTGRGTRRGQEPARPRPDQHHRQHLHPRPAPAPAPGDRTMGKRCATTSPTKARKTTVRTAKATIRPSSSPPETSSTQLSAPLGPPIEGRVRVYRPSCWHNQGALSRPPRQPATGPPRHQPTRLRSWLLGLLVLLVSTVVGIGQPSSMVWSQSQTLCADVAANPPTRPVPTSWTIE